MQSVRRKVVLLSLATLLVLISLAGFFAYKKMVSLSSNIESEANTLIAKTTEVKDETFSPAVEKEIKSLKDIESKEDQYKKLFRISAASGVQYSQSHDPAVRKFVGELNAFAKKNYPDYYKEADFLMNCADDECSSFNLPDEILAIKSEIENADLGLNKVGMLNALDDVGYTTGEERNRKLSDYAFVYSLLKAEAAKHNTEAENIAGRLEKYLIIEFGEEFENIQTDVANMSP